MLDLSWASPCNYVFHGVSQNCGTIGPPKLSASPSKIIQNCSLGIVLDDLEVSPWLRKPQKQGQKPMVLRCLGSSSHAVVKLGLILGPWRIGRINPLSGLNIPMRNGIPIVGMFNDPWFSPWSTGQNMEFPWNLRHWTKPVTKKFYIMSHPPRMTRLHCSCPALHPQTDHALKIWALDDFFRFTSSHDCPHFVLTAWREQIFTRSHFGALEIALPSGKLT